ncbi:MAG: GH39 family glycosyl hydrolase [Microgenomates group bacterium]
MKKVILLFFFFFSSLTIIFSLILIKKKLILFPQAEEKLANIIVDSSVTQGTITPIWQALAQGGEEKYPFDNILPEITNLQPKYIRIDHIYDFYNVVKKENERLIFSWQELDKIVDQILATGALPFLSLSYMPPTIAQNNDITAPPHHWEDWSKVVRETIQHYSGKNEKNLSNVVYEVWNEPDLFGGWKIGGKKDYRLLYKYAILGANQTQNTNPFKIGGPAITAPYKNWVNNFLDFTVKNNLRIDFYSWHRYSLNPSDFLEDINLVDRWLFQNAAGSLEKYLTEWGPFSEKSSLNDTDFSAAHLVATVRCLLQRVDLAFIFEIKDGLPPNNEKYWGGWGILTNEKAGEIEKKPKYFALEMLNKMTGIKIKLEGEGSWVTGFASKEENTLKIILVNLDKNNQHFENVPLTINNLENGNYSYQETFLRGINNRFIISITNGIFQRQIPLTSNNIVLLQLTKI